MGVNLGKQDERFAKMGAAVTSVATRCRDIGVGRFVSGAGVSCNDGAFITMIVTEDEKWTDDKLASAARSLCDRIYAEFGTSVEEQVNRLLAQDHQPGTAGASVARWHWSQRWPTGEREAKPEMKIAA